MEQAGKIYPLSKMSKARMYANIFKGKESIFNIDIVKKIVSKGKGDKTNYFQLFSGINLLKFLNIEAEVNKYFPCKLMKGNHAWVSVSSNGHYRYFTRNLAGVTIAMDFIDLYGIYANTRNVRRTIMAMEKEFGISFEDVWSLEQKSKYEKNLYNIENGINQSKYPNLYSLINNHLYILQAMNQAGSERLMGKNMEFNGEAVFFSSISYLKEHYIGEVSQSTVNQLINMYSLLGLITKVSEDDVPEEYMAIARKRMTIDKNRHNHISFYSIPEIKKAFPFAEKMAKVLLDNNIRYYMITQKSVLDLFGKEVMESVYVQKTQRKPYRVSNNFCDTDLAKHIFNRDLVDRGFVSKEILKKETSLNDSQINKLWHKLTSEAMGVVTRPSKRMKKEHCLETNEQVYIIKELYRKRCEGGIHI